MNEIKKIDWNNTSNKKIHEELLSIAQEHNALKNKINKLLEYLIEIEKEYDYGNHILHKRQKGEE